MLMSYQLQRSTHTGELLLQERPRSGETRGQRMREHLTVENSHCSIFCSFLNLLGLFNFSLHLPLPLTPETNRGYLRFNMSNLTSLDNLLQVV